LAVIASLPLMTKSAKCLRYLVARLEDLVRSTLGRGAACRQKRGRGSPPLQHLVNELVEARQHNAVKRVLARWLRYAVIVLDEVGYVPLAKSARSSCSK
jgi:hypothetical protein